MADYAGEAVSSAEIPARRLNAAETTFIVIGAIIGVGIFLNPAQAARLAGSADLALAAWAVGGLIALCGALTFASLGSVYHGVGAQYEILRDAYGPLAGFLFVFCNATAVQAGAIALIALVCTDHLAIAATGDPVGHVARLTMSTLLIVGLIAANIIGVRGSAAIQAVTVVTKISLLILIAGIAAFHGSGPDAAGAATAAVPATLPITLPALSSPVSRSDTPLALVLFSAVVPTLFAYGGWQHALWISGEVARPRRNLSIGILVGTTVVVIAYLTANWAYFRLLGYDGVATQSAIAAQAVARVWPAWGARIVAGGVAVSAFGVLNAQLLSGPRLIFRLAGDGHFFRVFGRLTRASGTPAAAIILLGLLALGLLFGAGPNATDQLTTGVVFVDGLFFALTGLAVFVLQRRRLRGNRDWLRLGFPIAPALFVLGELGLLIGAYREEATRGAAYIGVIWVIGAAGLYMFCFRRRA